MDSILRLNTKADKLSSAHSEKGHGRCLNNTTFLFIVLLTAPCRSISKLLKILSGLWSFGLSICSWAEARESVFKTQRGGEGRKRSLWVRTYFAYRKTRNERSCGFRLTVFLVIKRHPVQSIVQLVVTCKTYRVRSAFNASPLTPSLAIGCVIQELERAFEIRTTLPTFWKTYN